MIENTDQTSNHVEATSAQLFQEEGLCGNWKNGKPTRQMRDSRVKPPIPKPILLTQRFGIGELLRRHDVETLGPRRNESPHEKPLHMHRQFWSSFGLPSFSCRRGVFGGLPDKRVCAFIQCCLTHAHFKALCEPVREKGSKPPRRL